MKRLGLLVLFLSACRADRVEQGRYACDPMGDRAIGSVQCPGQSRCGLEGFCHDVDDISVAWRCDGPADCEQGFQCGLSSDGKRRECHDPRAPQAWRCTTSDDCSGSWVCGLDDARSRQCHDPAAPRAWPCDSTNDCVGGWACGLSKLGGRECHDPAVPEKWRCETNDDCLAGWQCGIGALNVRECHDPTRPEKWTCLAPSDCLGGWSCGLNDARTGRECHDPARPSAFACDTGADCVGGWVCGLASNRFQRECHDPLQPRPWACTDDGDCVGGWRCGLDGLCLDPGSEALGVPGPIDAGPLARINPTQQAPIDVFSISPRFISSTGRDTPTLAMLRAGRLQALVRDEAGTVKSWDLGVTTATTVVAQGPRSYDYDSNTDRFVRTEKNRVYAAGQGVTVYTLLPDGGALQQPLQQKTATLSPPPITTIKHGTVLGSNEYPSMLGFSSATNLYVVFDGPQSAQIRPINGLGTWSLSPPLLDMDDIFTPTTECVFLIDANGLWISPYPTYDFEPVHSPQFGNGACSGSRQGQRLERISTFGTARAAVVSSAWDGGAARVSILDLTPTVQNANSSLRCTSTQGLSCTSFDQIPFTVELGPCPACSTGELLDVAAIETVGQPAALETRCGSRDGGVSQFFRISSTPTNGCFTQPQLRNTALFSERDLRSAAQPSQGRVAFSSSAGQLWFGGSTLTAASLSLDRVAFGVARKGTAADDVVALAEGLVALPSTGFGLASSARPDLTAVATNEPTWVIDGVALKSWAGAATVDDGALLAQAVQPLALPQTLVRVERDAGAEAVLTAGTQLYSAHVEPPNVGLLVPRVSLVNPVTSSAFSAATDGGSFLEGYVVTATGVSFVRAESEARWRVQEVVLPASLTPKEVWFTNGRARLGFSDGTVFSLPSRLRISEPAPTGSVEDYVQACGQQLALTGTGLFRLEAVAGSSVGRWQPVPLPAGFASGFFGGRVHAVGANLYVFTQAGETARVTLSPCP